MRVERFSLFFPPLLARRKRGETEYAIGAIPLGGYVKITGMNPAEEIPPEVAHRAYYRQPVWKRIVVIAAGPAVNIVLAFLILWALIWANGVGEPHAVDRARRRTAARRAACSQPGDRIVVGRRRRAATPTTLREQIAAHQCAGEQVDGCVAADAGARSSSRATASERTVERHAGLRRRAGRALLARLQRTTRREPRRSARSRRPALGVDQMWRVTSEHGRARSRGSSRPRSARRSRGVVGSYEVTRQAIELDDRARRSSCSRSSRCRSASSTCSRSCRSTAATSSGRWPRRCAAARSRSA